jgi:hypothetical protein
MTGKKKEKGKKERDGGTLECGRKNERKIEIERERRERREREQKTWINTWVTRYPSP